MIALRTRSIFSKSRQFVRALSHDHGHGHGPMMPPMARRRPPTGTLPEEIEVVWDDGVAPETAIDFDAKHIPNKTVFFAWFGGIGFFVALYFLVKLSDPESRRPVAPRSAVLDHRMHLADMGLISEEEYEEGRV